MVLFNQDVGGSKEGQAKGWHVIPVAASITAIINLLLGLGLTLYFGTTS